jgi:hypothetical protein
MLQRYRPFLVDLIDGRAEGYRFGFNDIVPRSPVWSPTAESMAFAAIRSSKYDLFEHRFQPGGTSFKPILRTLEDKAPVDWSGDLLLYVRTSGETHDDLMALSLSAPAEQIPIAVSPARENDGRFSPDGKWVAYESDEPGRNEIFIQPFPGSPALRRQVSVAGGASPQWSRSGSELFFLSADNHLMTASISFSDGGRAIAVTTPTALFPSPLPEGTTYAPSPDGNRFLISMPVEGTPIILLSDWTGGKKRQQEQ